MILLASVVLGCAIPAGILWLLMVSDTKVRSRKDVEGVLSVPFLGEDTDARQEGQERSGGA